MVLRSRDGASRRRLLLLNALLVASALVTAVVVARVAVTRTDGTAGLAWNLFLAWIPFLLALWIYDAARRSASAWTLAALGALWLLFLPNAPYIVTDFKWLRHMEPTYWFDPLTIGAAAALGLVLGFVSVYLVQAVVSARLGRAAGWATALGALVLSGVGVYLGRFQRWNSWEAVTEPSKIFGGLARGVLDPLAHAEPLALSAFFAVAWCGGYALFYSVFRPHLHRLEDR
ncbi:MAG TPA: DUF1361 domain-containing protein [Gaiella sp.]|nr:DUF1361 domain-containing protein [Gaiella sp.]